MRAAVAAQRRRADVATQATPTSSASSLRRPWPATAVRAGKARSAKHGARADARQRPAGMNTPAGGAAAPASVQALPRATRARLLVDVEARLW